MELPNDSALRQIDARFLGPKNIDLPWEARYVAYPVGFAVLVVLILLERKTGIGIGFSAIAVTLLAAVAITTEIMRRVDAERPVRSVFTTFWHEIGTPRRPKPIDVEMQARTIQCKNGSL